MNSEAAFGLSDLVLSRFMRIVTHPRVFEVPSTLADACLAAVAIENGCEWITTDRDFSRFEGLKWRHPLR